MPKAAVSVLRTLVALAAVTALVASATPSATAADAKPAPKKAAKKKPAAQKPVTATEALKEMVEGEDVRDFRTFCDTWMGKLKDRTAYNTAHIAVDEGGSGSRRRVHQLRDRPHLHRPRGAGQRPDRQDHLPRDQIPQGRPQRDGGDGKRGHDRRADRRHRDLPLRQRPLAILSAATTPPAWWQRRLRLFNAAVVTGGVVLMPAALLALAFKRDWRVGLSERFGADRRDPARTHRHLDPRRLGR